MIKKTLATLAVLNALFFTAPTIVPNTDVIKFQQKQNYTYNLENITTDYFDDKSFDSIAQIAKYRGYDKYNAYMAKYEYVTDDYGNFHYESIEANNEKFKGEKAAPIFSMFGPIEPAPNEKFKIIRFANGDYSYTDEIEGIFLTEHKGKLISSGIKKWEAKSKLKKTKDLFNKFKKIMTIENKISESKGHNNYDKIMSIIPELVKEKKEPSHYYSNTSYNWWDPTSQNWNIAYDCSQNKITLNKSGKDAFLLEIRLNHLTDKPVQLNITRNYLNKSNIEQEKYIKDIYTQEQVDDMFKHAEGIYEMIKESVKDLPYKETPQYHGPGGGGP